MLKRIEVVRRGNTVFIRKVPYTRYFPSINQINWRLKFTETVKSAKGKKGFKNGLPVVAAKVKEELSGATVGRKKKLKKYEEDILSLAELKLLALRHNLARLIAQRRAKV